MLNRNSANALLKTLEEPTENTFFFLSYNSNNSIFDTIKSRCKEFRVNFLIAQKKEIISNLIQYFKFKNVENELINHFVHETPGNIIKFIKLQV